MKSDRFLTQSEYARRKGVTRQSVHEAIAAGRISLIDGRIDPEVADIQWAKNTRPPRIGAPGSSSSASSPGEEARQDPKDPTYLDAKIRREQALAELAELELAERQGTLVLSEQVTRTYASIAIQIRESVSAMADRLAPLVAAETDQEECHRLIAADCRRTLQALAQSVREGE